MGRDEISYGFYKGGLGIIGRMYESFKKIWSVERVPRC